MMRGPDSMRADKQNFIRFWRFCSEQNGKTVQTEGSFGSMRCRGRAYGNYQSGNGQNRNAFGRFRQNGYK